MLMFITATLAVPLIISSPLDMNAADKAALVQCAIFVAGIGTFVQALGIGPVGNRLPILMGTTFIFMSPAILIAQEYDYATFIGAGLVGGIFIAVVGVFGIKLIKRVFPPMIMGCIIMAMGIGMFGSAANYCAGGTGATDYGSLSNLALAAITMLAVVLINVCGKGFLKGISVLFGLVVGTVIAAFMGKVNLSAVTDAAWVSVPQPFHFGVNFEIGPIIIFFVLYIVAAVQFIGDATNTTHICAGRDLTDKEASRGIVSLGLTSSVSSVFNMIPMVSYSGNVGLIRLTGAKSRILVSVAGVMIFLLGFLPKIATILSMVPAPVFGGATIVTFGIITTTGMDILNREKLSDRDKIVVAVSLALGLGFGATKAATSNFPFYVSVLINGIPGTAFSGAILNAILPKNKTSNANSVDEKFEQADSNS